MSAALWWCARDGVCGGRSGGRRCAAGGSRVQAGGLAVSRLCSGISAPRRSPHSPLLPAHPPTHSCELTKHQTSFEDGKATSDSSSKPFVAASKPLLAPVKTSSSADHSAGICHAGERGCQPAAGAVGRRGGEVGPDRRGSGSEACARACLSLSFLLIDLSLFGRHLAADKSGLGEPMATDLLRFAI